VGVTASPDPPLDTSKFKIVRFYKSASREEVRRVQGGAIGALKELERFIKQD